MLKVVMHHTNVPTRRTLIAGLCIGVAVFASIQPMRAGAVELPALELPALDEQDTIVVTADQAWESDDGNVLNFKGDFELKAPDYYMHSDTAEIHGKVESPSRVVATGNPVRFWVRDQDTDERTQGQGDRVEYEREQNLLRVSGKAILQDKNTVMRSSLLEYNTQTKRLVTTGTDGVEIVTQQNRD